MIKVLVCGEGRHDVGESKRPYREDRTTDEDGWLQAFLRRLIPGQTTFKVVPRRELVLQRRQQRQYQPLPQGHGKKALLCKIRAKAGGYDLVVFMADADSTKRRDWRRTHSDISDGFDRLPGPNGIPCVPMSASENWLLADGQAWQGIGLTKLNLLPKKPKRSGVLLTTAKAIILTNCSSEYVMQRESRTHGKPGSSSTFFEP